MTLIESINKLIRDSINLILVDPNYSIAAKQKDAPRPQGSYADVEYISGLSIGWEQKEFVNTGLDLTENISGVREIIMGVNFFRENAVDNARLVRTALVRESIQSLFIKANIGLNRRSEVREISEPLENGWEERAQFDIVLNAVGTDSDLVTSIATVDIAGEYQARGLVYNFNIEV